MKIASDLPDLVQEDRPVGAAGLQPAIAVLQGTRKSPPAVSEQGRFHQCGRDGREIDAKEVPARDIREAPRLGIEGDVAAHGNALGHQLLARARGAGDQHGQIAHSVIERPPVAAHVVGEDRLPHGGAEASRRHRPPHDPVECEVEGSADLVLAGEEVGDVLVGQMHAGQFEKLSTVPVETPVERGAVQAFGHRVQPTLDQFQQLIHKAIVEGVDHQVAIERELPTGGFGIHRMEAGADGGGHLLHLGRDGADVRGFGIVARLHAPDVAMGDERGSGRNLLRLDALR